MLLKKRAGRKEDRVGEPQTVVTSVKVSAGQNGRQLEDPASGRTSPAPVYPFPHPLNGAARLEQRHGMNAGSGCIYAVKYAPHSRFSWRLGGIRPCPRRRCPGLTGS